MFKVGELVRVDYRNSLSWKGIGKITRFGRCHTCGKSSCCLIILMMVNSIDKIEGGFDLCQRHVHKLTPVETMKWRLLGNV